MRAAPPHWYQKKHVFRFNMCCALMVNGVGEGDVIRYNMCCALMVNGGGKEMLSEEVLSSDG